jgi:cyclomaltodextrinase / maltogenic alpha-amylase / neopullulanase
MKIKTLILFIFFCLTVYGQQNSTLIHPYWSINSSIYEVNVRQYTPEGTFKAFEKHLPELKALGVDILWLMPINPIGQLNRKGSLGSYYSVRDYKAVNPEFGTIDDLKALVKKAHSMKMHVIIDWVANHTAWDNVWLKDHKEFFTKDAKGNLVAPVADWTDAIDLNYDNKELWNAMIDAMSFWLKECNIDGFRCDVAAMVPTEFWLEAYPHLTKIKKVFMLAEASENYLHKAFDMTYNWQLKDLMNAIAAGKNKAADLAAFFEKEKKDYGPDDYRMNFTSNHDENSWNGSEFERLGDGTQAFAVLCQVAPGMPLIYTGQEAGMNKRLRFFEKDTVNWQSYKMRAVYTTLNKLKKDNQALWNGLNGGEIKSIDCGNENVYALTREKNGRKIFAIFNFSKAPQKIKISSEAIAGKYKDVFNKGPLTNIKNNFETELQPWGYKVFSK